MPRQTWLSGLSGRSVLLGGGKLGTVAVRLTAARSFGVIDAAVLSSGRQPRGRSLDLQIAVIALANGLPLYTRNPDDFRGLDDLVTIVAV